MGEPQADRGWVEPSVVMDEAFRQRKRFENDGAIVEMAENRYLAQVGIGSCSGVKSSYVELILAAVAAVRAAKIRL